MTREELIRHYPDGEDESGRTVWAYAPPALMSTLFSPDNVFTRLNGLNAPLTYRGLNPDFIIIDDIDEVTERAQEEE